MQRHREIVVNLVSLEPIKEPCALSLKPLKDLGCLLVIAGAERMKEMRTCLTPRGSSTWRRQQKVRSLKASAGSAHSWTTLFPLRLVNRESDGQCVSSSFERDRTNQGLIRCPEIHAPDTILNCPREATTVTVNTLSCESKRLLAAAP